MLSSSGQASPLDTGDHEGWPQAPPWENRPDCAPTMARNPTLSLLIISEKYWNCPWFIPTKTHRETLNCCPNNPRNLLLFSPPPPPLPLTGGRPSAGGYCRLVGMICARAWQLAVVRKCRVSWWKPSLRCVWGPIVSEDYKAARLQIITAWRYCWVSLSIHGSDERSDPAPSLSLTSCFADCLHFIVFRVNFANQGNQN